MGSKSRLEAKRSLGQNFFVNSNLAEKIANIVLENGPKHITEIGSGKGAFTQLFYGTTVGLSLVEKDYELSQILQNTYKNAQVYNLDFLDYKLPKIDTTYFGSLPFNVAGDIIAKIIKSDTFKNPAFFIIQKEVATKYLNKDINPTGLIRSIYSDFEILFDIKPGSFSPRPKVTSSFVKFLPKKGLLNRDRRALEELIERSFKMPRKTINNNLKMYNYNISKEFQEKRADQLTLSEYVSILQHS